MSQDRPRDLALSDPEAEKCVLGSILRDPVCAPDVFAELTLDDFYLPRHRGLFGIMEQLDTRSAGSCDPVTVAHEIERLGQAEDLGGRRYLEELMAAVPTLAFLENHLGIVRDCAIRRRLVAAAEEIQRTAAEGAGAVSDLVDFAERTVFQVGDRLVRRDLTSARELVARNLDAILSSKGAPRGLQTGFLDLDAYQGFRAGDFAVLAARPSMGKTALALNVLERVSLQSSRAVLLYSLEMPGEQILMRLVSSVGRVRHDALRRGMLGPDDRSRVTVALGELNRARVWIDDSSRPTLAELRAKARRLRRENNLDLVIVDYLQLIEMPRRESRQVEIADASRQLKGLARELDVPVLALAQLNRDPEKREGNRPKLADLRESGAMEQDADLVLLLFRESVYKQTPENEREAELIVAKNRHGPTGTIRLRFTPEHMRFENAVREPVF